MATELHQARFDAVVRELHAGGAHSVADLGCGQGELLRILRDHPQFTRLIGIDIDPDALAEARSLLDLDLLSLDPRLQVRLCSFEDSGGNLPEVDAAVLLETIEHIHPGRLSRVERVVFEVMAPRLVLVTTPNQEYNTLHGLSVGQRRHPGHRFEWTRAQFRDWCQGVAKRRYYNVRFIDIGPVDQAFGSSTQMACFRMPGLHN